MRDRTLALVESATQLINAAEWAHASSETRSTDITVLSPTDRESVRQIQAVAAMVRASGIAVTVRPVRVAGPSLPFHYTRLVAEVTRARRLLIGDTFSRFIHALLPLTHAEHIVVVDDGTATWDYATCIDAESALVRWARPPSTTPRHAERATALLTPSATRTIDVFTCLSNAAPAGAMALANRYRWVRSLARPQILDGHVDLLGTSLVGSGVLDRHSYLNAIAGLARTTSAVRYLAHRRESDSLVEEIATIPNLRVLRPDLPVEILLRRGPVARRIVAFPSTAAHTLPVVLSDVDVEIVVQPIHRRWFTPAATLRAQSFVTRIAAEAPTKTLTRRA